jgi:hypothetical protein
MTRFLSNTLIISLLFLAGCSYEPQGDGYTATITSDVSHAARITSSEWRQISGPSQAIIVCPACPTTQVINLNLGVYSFEFSVTNEHGTGRDTMTVTVLAPPLLFRLLDFRAKAFEFYNLVEWEIEQAGDKVELLRNNRVIMLWDDRAKVAFKDYGFEGISRYQLRQTDDAGKVALSEII